MVASMAWWWAGMMEIYLVGLMGDRTADCLDRRLVDESVSQMVDEKAVEWDDTLADQKVG